MKILHISDTHSHHRQLQDLPAADVIVHSGDFTMVGTEAEVIDFMEWFCALPYKHKVFLSETMTTVFSEPISMVCPKTAIIFMVTV